MAGIYIHIPFCKQKCNYCNFHFSTQLQHIERFIEALKLEMQLQKDYLQGASVSTLYLGGGTPSVLSTQQVSAIFDALAHTFGIAVHALDEVTFELNPDDCSPAYLNFLKQAGVNRLSIGIQSFKTSDLVFMQRAHNIAQSHDAIQQAVVSGFKNVSIDLIYGIPGLSDEEWEANIETALSYDVTHISAYALTVEPKTLLESQIKKQVLPALDEAQAARQFEILVTKLEERGFEQYEISNFAQPDAYAIHNTNYWKSQRYLGLGPSAHSFNGMSRQWNISNNALYVQSLLHHRHLDFELEVLTIIDLWNEYMMKNLRTRWGIELAFLRQHFPEKFLVCFEAEVVRLKQSGFLKTDEDDQCVILTEKGKLFADYVSSELFLPQDFE